jgi:probable addiction module antidote protein
VLASDYLETEADIAAYLTACAQEDDPAVLVAALGDVARARNITQLAEKTGMTHMVFIKHSQVKAIPALRPWPKLLMRWD